MSDKITLFPQTKLDIFFEIINRGVKETKHDYNDPDPKKIKDNNKYLFEFAKCGLEHMHKKNTTSKNK